MASKPWGDYSLGTHAGLVRDLMSALGVERATIVGQSFGGGVGLQFVWLFPERCERIVLASSGGLGREVHGLLRALSLPGAGLVLRLGCRARLAALATSVTSRAPAGLSPALAEIVIPSTHARALGEAMPGSRLVIFEDAGHYLHCEQPDRFVEVVADLIAATPPGPGTRTGPGNDRSDQRRND